MPQKNYPATTIILRSLTAGYVVSLSIWDKSIFFNCPLSQYLFFMFLRLGKSFQNPECFSESVVGLSVLYSTILKDH